MTLKRKSGGEEISQFLSPLISRSSPWPEWKTVSAILMVKLRGGSAQRTGYRHAEKGSELGGGNQKLEKMLRFYILSFLID